MLDNLDTWDKVAACAYLCEMTHGYENQEFTSMMQVSWRSDAVKSVVLNLYIKTFEDF